MKKRWKRLVARTKHIQPEGPWYLVAIDGGNIVGGCIAVEFTSDLREWWAACTAAGLTVALAKEPRT
jgi:hypothetical protein